MRSVRLAVAVACGVSAAWHHAEKRRVDAAWSPPREVAAGPSGRFRLRLSERCEVAPACDCVAIRTVAEDLAEGEIDWARVPPWVDPGFWLDRGGTRAFVRIVSR